MGNFKQLLLTISLTALFLLFSCSRHNKQDEQIIEAMKNAVESSNNSINMSTAYLLKALEEKTTEYCSMERAKTWYPKAQLISKNSKELFDYLEAIKRKTIFDMDVIREVFKKTLAFKDSILGTDSSILIGFKNDFGFVNKSAWLLGIDTLTTSHFKNKDLTAISFSAIISMLQNEIKKIENKTIAYCNIHVGCMIDGFDTYSAIIGQNSNYLKPGSELEITAGVGAFSMAAQPDITINRKKIKLGDYGFSIYKIKVPANPGDYIIPVSIKYFNQVIGKEEEYNTNVKYTVTPPCNQ